MVKTEATLQLEYADALHDGASEKVLTDLSKAIDEAHAREEREAREARAKAKAETDRGLKIRGDLKRVNDAKKLEAGRAAIQTTKLPRVVFMDADNQPVASVAVYPYLAIGGTADNYGLARGAIGRIWQAIERNTAARATNARARAMGMAPTLDESRATLMLVIKDVARAAIARGVVRLAK